MASVRAFLGPWLLSRASAGLRVVPGTLGVPQAPEEPGVYLSRRHERSSSERPFVDDERGCAQQLQAGSCAPSLGEPSFWAPGHFLAPCRGEDMMSRSHEQQPYHLVGGTGECPLRASAEQRLRKAEEDDKISEKHAQMPLCGEFSAKKHNGPYGCVMFFSKPKKGGCNKGDRCEYCHDARCRFEKTPGRKRPRTRRKEREDRERFLPDLLFQHLKL